MSRYTPITATGRGLTATGATTTGLFPWEITPLPQIGMTAILAGLMVMLATWIVARIDRTNRPADAAFHEGYEMGYDRGWTEGRRAGVPTLVEFPARPAVAEIS